uniref:Beta-amylase n=1 Tax=Chlamydomonas chlamydogama TaxID=225041 RepID=A0A6T5U2K4_9CHLO|mmetsp:Transcript_598/g.1360  ORF Transcript_598/g.1360 Transcript_598/m.1360 type:complete len:1023 (+) Transcript_598:221-3289(+)|eukprot:CAMPEP_0202907570 /NCGR_PEP_ID=MMETSP1392-20130828/43086_1 /ASSEMBLY_ACC=CAM_ASM_000868 /TAXON_ID=225041 /ORGANISM="Chlamydomonas chlamydogama, Strain SAG 11-48b" /LENGTH=1022 /DNA_ID=CAMNT_0049596535 /DNA_START=165 /DNA_END=3233 /DNA_ORIENTATION=-
MRTFNNYTTRDGRPGKHASTVLAASSTANTLAASLAKQTLTGDLLLSCAKADKPPNSVRGTVGVRGASEAIPEEHPVTQCEATSSSAVVQTRNPLTLGQGGGPRVEPWIETPAQARQSPCTSSPSYLHSVKSELSFSPPKLCLEASPEAYSTGVNPRQDSEAMFPPKANGIPVFVMLPLDTVNKYGVFRYATAPWFTQALQLLAASGTYGVAVDVWWGAVERDPRSYNWSGYKQLVEMVKQTGLKVQVVLSFHACGGNVGDTAQIPLPQWVLKCGEMDPDLFHTDRPRGGCPGQRNREYLSVWVDEEKVLYGRSPLQCYEDFMASFRDCFIQELGSVIEEVVVGAGPCGELRFPSYVEANGWRFPGVGEFQCYDRRALASLAQAARTAGKPEWGNGGPHDSGEYNSAPEETGFYNHEGSWDTPYGRFFLEWYSGSLLKHADRVMSVASKIFKGHTSGTTSRLASGTMLQANTRCPYSDGSMDATALPSSGGGSAGGLHMIAPSGPGSEQSMDVEQSECSTSTAPDLTASVVPGAPAGSSAADAAATAITGLTGTSAAVAAGLLSDRVMRQCATGSGRSSSTITDSLDTLTTGTATTMGQNTESPFMCYSQGSLHDLHVSGGGAGSGPCQTPPYIELSALCNELADDTSGSEEGLAPESGSGSAVPPLSTGPLPSHFNASRPMGAATGCDNAADADRGQQAGAVAGPSGQGLVLTLKIAGVHWWFRSRSHAAELTAGYYNTATRDGYAPIVDLCAKHKFSLTLTCVEMCDTQHPPPALCGPEGLLKQVRSLCATRGVPLSGENALPIFLVEGIDSTALDRIVYNTRAWHGAAIMAAYWSVPRYKGVSAHHHHHHYGGAYSSMGGPYCGVPTTSSSSGFYLPPPVASPTEQGQAMYRRVFASMSNIVSLNRGNSSPEGGSTGGGSAAQRSDSLPRSEDEHTTYGEGVYTAPVQLPACPPHFWSCQSDPAIAATGLRADSYADISEPLPAMRAVTMLRLGPEILQVSCQVPWMRFLWRMQQGGFF